MVHAATIFQEYWPDGVPYPGRWSRPNEPIRQLDHKLDLSQVDLP